MKTNKEKEIDDLFRNGFEQPDQDMDFREDDWDAMEALLDEGKKRRGIIYWLPVIGAVAAMLLLVGGWFIFSPGVKPKTGAQNGLAGTTIVKQPINVISGHKDTLIDGSKNASQTAGISTVNDQNAHKINGTANKIDDKTASGTATGMNSYAVNSAIERSISKHPFNTLPNQDLQAGNTLQDDGLNQRGALLTSVNPAIDLGEITPSDILNNKLPAAGKPVLTTVKGDGKLVIKQSNAFRPRLAVTVLASPDINGVNTFKNSQVGTNVGLLFSVGISKKFTVSTGAMYSKKPYLTNFADYHTSYQFKTNPENVSADCRVLDIPINLDYQVYSKQRNKFSIGTGISSYFMLKENYHYNYEYPGTVGPTDYDISNKNKHILGVLNLDATYQRQLNSKFSVGIQPYMKVPLTNIGYSQVKLQSAGVAVGVTWNVNSFLKH